MTDLPSQTPDALKRLLLHRLESLHRAGVAQIGKAKPPEVTPTMEQEPSMAATTPATAQQKRIALAELEERVSSCTLCDELACSRTQTVFGVGDPATRLCFFGEAPGADEDRQGEPFVGRAGQLLNDIITKGMGLQRSDVYILNVLKCRPPGNRNPNTSEIDNCREFFETQLEIIQPEFICCLGSVAAQTLLDTTTTIGRLRGRLHDYNGIKVVATYHPAYLLRNPNAKKATWEDIQLLMREMGLPVQEKS